jgi:hypothetical protein
MSVMARLLSRQTCGLMVVAVTAIAGCTHPGSSSTNNASQQTAPNRSTALRPVAPSHIPSSRYATLPQTLLTRTVKDSPICRYQRSASALRITATPAESSSAIAAGKSAIATSLRAVASYVLTTSTTIRAYPAQLTDPPVIPTVRSVWVVEYTGLQMADGGGPSPAPGQPEAIKPPFTAAADYIDARTGMELRTDFCR